MQRKRKKILRTYPTVVPEHLQKFICGLAQRFDATLVTLHPSEMGRSEWLVFMEFSNGVEHCQYVDEYLAHESKYVEAWIRECHRLLVSKRSIR